MIKASEESEFESSSPSDRNGRTSAAPVNNITINGAGNEDQPASLKNDTLGFRPYVEAIFSYLKNPKTKAPFTLSIEGDWGIGKSSFMFQLEESLLADKQRTIRFNAWRHDKVESMWAAFALHFMKELMSTLTPFERAWANLRLKWKRFDLGKGWYALVKTAVLLIAYAFIGIKLVRYFITADKTFSLIQADKVNFEGVFNILGSTGIILGGLYFLNKLSDVVGNPFKADLQRFIICPKYEGNVAFIEEFHRDFEQTLQILTRNTDKVFIFIDDLDRAEVTKATELMQGLNMMISNSTRLIFIIGMDREKIAAGVAAKYKDLLPFLNPKQESLTGFKGLMQAKDFGYKYLEKFVQLSFQIPTPSARFTRAFIDSLSGVKPEDEDLRTRPVSYKPVLVVNDGEDTKDFREVTILLSKFFEYNPRKLKQYVNAFRLKAHIANSTGLFNSSDDTGISYLTIPQLGKFMALTTLWPSLVDSLINEPNLFKKILKNDVVSNTLGTDRKDPEVEEWKENTAFMEVLKLKSDNNTNNSMDYSMQNVDVRNLIQTSSPVKRETTKPGFVGNFDKEAAEKIITVSESESPSKDSTSAKRRFMA